MKIVQKVDADTAFKNTLQSRQSSHVPGSMPPPSLPDSNSFRPPASLHQPSQPRIPPERKEEPLFLPSSQLSVTENKFLEEAGFGDIETLEDLNALLEGEGEEVDFTPSQVQKPSTSKQIEGQNMRVDQGTEHGGLSDEMDFGPTQATQKVCSLPIAQVEGRG
jgi:cell cycle checkpoint control protein RAD9A